MADNQVEPRTWEPDELHKMLREQAWSYFDRHAEQRLKVFNYYVLLCTAATAGFVATANAGAIENGWPLGLLLAAISFVFWKLDDRSRELVKHSEAALKTLEDRIPLSLLPDDPDGLPNQLKLFRREEAESNKRQLDGSSFLRSRFSYTRCFNLVFSVIGFSALGLSAILALVAACKAVRGG